MLRKSSINLFTFVVMFSLVLAFGTFNVSAANITVEEKSDSAIKVKIFPGTLTNSEEEAIEFLKLGTVAIGATSAGHIAGYYPDVQFLQLPYLFKNK